MTPRKSTSESKNRTPIPPEALTAIKENFIETFGLIATDKVFVVNGELYLDEILLQVGLREKSGVRQINFEASIDHNIEERNALERLLLASDAIHSMVEQYIEAEGDINLPETWVAYPYEGQQVWLSSSNFNTDLEAQANALLGEKGLAEIDAISEQVVDELFSAIRKVRTQH